ncbi:tyrosine-type recombinase/integrase [Planosporangium flavigriseum]|uniref:Integrase n=1 Tax=Planosporangium flavigriseum TaxID=373681 RepID=A0A8J3LLS0_9ACTN|nr:site-specific integrase [Planosporangium flavigriseum]NJC64017.1 tyrosine-type recombinase/integrase [Planosporangium flavigriseum]GIG72898.1 integrase [Planosporangium flavigriseum]
MINDLASNGWTLHWANPSTLGADLPEWRAGDRKRATDGLMLGEKRFPVFIGPDGWPDRDLLRFATRGWLRPKSLTTKRSYAIDIRVWLQYLHVACNGKHWLDADVEDTLDFHYWRTREAANRGRVFGDDAARGLSALVLLYGWAMAEGLIDASPIRQRRSPSGKRLTTVQQPRNAGHHDVKWLTRRAFDRWKRVGFEGYDAAGMPRSANRVRTQSRNVAFANLLYATGLRRAEGGALLDVEIPVPTGEERLLSGDVASGIAKYRKRRKFYLERTHLRTVEDYIRFERAGAVHVANERGLYERLPGRLVVTGIVGSGKDRVVTYQDEQGRVTRQRLDLLDAGIRARLLRKTPQGWQPLWLWLTETGLPFEVDSWNKTFEQASRRCQVAGVDLDVTPHMLRHSYALHMLVQAQRAFLLRTGLTADERTRYQRLFGNVWELVRDLLGHASVETTRKYYLEPVRGLQLDLLLTAAADSPVTEVDAVIARIGSESGLVQDVPEEPTS